MKRIVLIIGALLIGLVIRAQSVTYTCRYWFDQNFAQAATATFSNSTWQAELDVGSLADGLHTLHLHVMDTSLKWSAPQNYLFLKTTVTQPENYVFHHWIDQGQMQSSAIGNGQFLLDVATLDAGLHTLHVMLKGCEYTASQSYIFLKPELTGFDAENWVYHCWFDEDYAHRETDSLGNGNFLLDVSDLEEGLHTLNVILQGNSLTATQSYMFMRVEMIETNSIDMSNLTYSCWFDQDYEQRVTDSLRDGNILLDVADLTDGLHTVNVMLQGGTGTLTSTRTYMFLKVAVEDPSIEQQYRCWFDQDYSTMQSGMLGGGIFQLEVSDLSNGLHIVNVQLEKETRTAPQSYFFYKIPFGGNGLNKWEYCINGDWANKITTNIVPSVDTLSIVSLLPVPPQPVRSSCFHFHPNGDEPYLNAKNEITLRFWTADEHFMDRSAFYVDEYVSEPIQADDLERDTTACIPAPRDNQMQWYKVPLVVGDSIAFRTDKACTVQLFAPSGEEVYTATASEALVFGGIHAWEDGDYYLVVHDVTGSGDEICLTNVYVHKYAILAYDVHLVGNGGCSTITFQGNGFNSLLDAYLLNAENDTIGSIHTGHESNTNTTIVFNFLGENLGMYDAVFQFYGETIRVNNAIQVEEPVDMYLTFSVSYPNQFLRDTEVTYNIDITNHGNMSAYAVPIYVYIATPITNGISHLEFEGLGLSSLFDYFDLDLLSASEIEELRIWAEEMGDDHYFYKSLSVDELTGDSIMVRSNYFFITTGARTTSRLKLKMKSTDPVDVYVTVPNDKVPPKIIDPESIRTCLVSYNCNGGTNCPNDEIVVRRTSIVLAEAPTKEGYTFFGWSRAGSTFQPGSSYFVTNDVTFTARWIPDDGGEVTMRTVSYNCNGGSNCPDEFSVQDSTYITLASAPIKEQCIFLGWSDGSNSYQPGESYFISSDITFTAMWKRKGGGGGGNNPGGGNGGGNNGGGSPPLPYCCIKDKIQCTVDLVCDGLGFASIIPGGFGVASNVANCVCGLLSLLNEHYSIVFCDENSMDYWDAEDGIRKGRSIGGTIISCLKPYFSQEQIKNFLNIAGNIINGLTLADIGHEVTDCVEVWKTVKPGCPDGDSDGGPSDPVNSLDPNDIHGYLSESGSHYMRQEIQNVQYEIEFENDTTLATAAAHTIIVRDTLDATKFDLNSLAARSVTIGDKRLELNGEQTFARTLDLRPEIYVIAQVEQDYDPTTGIIQWTIQSLDPMTMEPTNDPNQGVLPVNYYGNGVGFIDYSINLLEAFDDGTAISNRAGIIFDQNEVIMTPVWTNIIDAVKPVSQIESVETVNDSLLFNFVSSDNRSGVWYHTLYHRNDSTEMEWQVKKARIFGNEFMLQPELLTTEYLVMAVDSAGNHEEKEMVAEYIYYYDGPSATTQANALAQGWNWWSTYIEQNGINGMEMLQNSLGHNGLTIKSQNGFTDNFYQDMGYDYWYGSLESITNEQGYLINVSENGNASLTGMVANPANHPITIQPNWNWIGYPVATPQAVTSALAGINPTADDVVKGQSDFTSYYEGFGWYPDDFMLIPGQSYLYFSNANANKTLIYSGGGRGGVLKTGKAEKSFWKNDVHAFADNLSVMAVVSIDNEEQRDENLELGAFVNGECRGSVRLRHFAPLDRYYAMLTVSGQTGELVEFRLIHTESHEMNEVCANRLVFSRNAIVGSLGKPYEIHFGDEIDVAGSMTLYPNPVKCGKAFTLNVPQGEIITEIVISDVLGNQLRHETGALNTNAIKGLSTAGVYVVKAVAKSGNTYYERLIVE